VVAPWGGRRASCTLVGVTPAADAPPTDVTVLVVDDQAPFRIAMRSVLRHLDGFTLVGEAETGEASIELFARLSPMLVLMDINLPGVSGIEATKRILADAPHAVVFLCSTYAQGDLPPAASTSGAAAYIHKEELTARLLRDLWYQHGTTAATSSDS
jgi:two-component system, NarL family, invasion response regulator UvrY